MPAASAEKRARQRANKTLRKETIFATFQTPDLTDSKASEGPASPSPPQSPVPNDITHPASIERLIGLARDSPPNSALGIVWRYAFEEGKEFGYSEGTKMINGLDVNDITRIGVERGIERGIEIGRDREKRVWDAAGHGNICIMVARPPRGVAVQTVDPRPHSIATVQTVPFETHDASSQTTHPPSPIPDHTPSVAISPSPVPLNWADDAASLPTKILPSPLPPRDFSDLRSSKSNPFSSLQRRSKNQGSRARQSRRPHSHFNFNSFNSRHHISFTPSRSHCHTETYPHLNWESDPRLFDLSRSLKALGWIRAY